MHEHHGQCHCGNLAVTFRSAAAPEDTPVRACQCSFCRKHNTRAVADPNGEAQITVRDESALQRYRFGLGTAEFLVCGRCGVYIAAVMTEGRRPLPWRARPLRASPACRGDARPRARARRELH